MVVKGCCHLVGTYILDVMAEVLDYRIAIEFREFSGDNKIE